MNSGAIQKIPLTYKVKTFWRGQWLRIMYPFYTIHVYILLYQQTKPLMILFYMQKLSFKKLTSTLEINDKTWNQTFPPFTIALTKSPLRRIDLKYR